MPMMLLTVSAMTKCQSSGLRKPMSSRKRVRPNVLIVESFAANNFVVFLFAFASIDGDALMIEMFEPQSIKNLRFEFLSVMNNRARKFGSFWFVAIAEICVLCESLSRDEFFVSVVEL